MRNFPLFLISRVFWLNVLLVIILCVSLFFLLNWWLNSHTHHGESVTVPNLRGLNENQMQSILEEKGLRYEVVDSIYHPKIGKGAVVEQDPEPDMLVKVNRTIYLTLNASHPPKVKMPDLRDLSLRQAVATLETFGLKPGRSVYVPDMAYNAVLGQQVQGKDVKPGDEFVKGTVVDLILGQGQEGAPVAIPRLTGLSFKEAMEALRLASFNLGSVITDGEITDSLNAVVYRQIPGYAPEAMHKAGGMIDLFITTDPAKIPSSNSADE